MSGLVVRHLASSHRFPRFSTETSDCLSLVGASSEVAVKIVLPRRSVGGSRQSEVVRELLAGNMHPWSFTAASWSRQA